MRTLGGLMMRGKALRSLMNCGLSMDLIRRLVNVVGEGGGGNNVYLIKNRMLIRGYSWI